MEKKEIGKITHYFGQINVGAIRLTDTLKVGDTISIEGAHTSLEQQVKSIQIDRKELPEAGPGDEIGIKVEDRVREGDTVFLVIP